MDEIEDDRLWQMIENARKEESFFTYLKESFESEDEVFIFDRMLKRRLFDAYTFPLLAVQFVILSGTSDERLPLFGHGS